MHKLKYEKKWDQVSAAVLSGITDRSKAYLSAVVQSVVKMPKAGTLRSITDSHTDIFGERSVRAELAENGI